MDIDLLKGSGLTQGESKVYLALLELGSSTTGPIVEKSGVTKSIIYRILDKLMKKGLVSFIIKEKTKHFQAAPPIKILDYMDERKDLLDEQRNKLQEKIPQLTLLQASAKESKVTIYEGFKGMVTVHDKRYEKLKKGDEYYFLGIPAIQPEHFHSYWIRDHKRESKGINVKLLYNQGTEKSILEKRNSFKHADARYMPTDIKTPAWFMGYKDTIVISLVSSNQITIEIVNQEIANAFRAYFEEYWKRSKPLN